MIELWKSKDYRERNRWSVARITERKDKPSTLWFLGEVDYGWHNELANPRFLTTSSHTSLTLQELEELVTKMNKLQKEEN